MQPRALTLSLLATALLLASATASASGDVAAGKQKAQACAACHGADGNSTDPQYPRLAGQYADYIAQALHEYKDGQRKNAIMVGMAAPLSDTDIDNLAAYFSSLPGKLSDLHGKVQGGD